ncbi:MAG: DUF2164 domain-containing protein [Planctomycetota bacterium]|nr:DUF2164 domain-containing protein [Planctomycetota bacterium]
MPIDFPAEEKDRIYRALQEYVRENLDRDLGLLQTERLFEFMVKLIGASAYNRAIADAQAWIGGKLLDLEGDLHERVEYDV